MSTPNTAEMARLLRKIEENEARREKERITRETKLFADGFRWKLTAWIHPEAGGDDYMLVQYSTHRPSDAKVKTMLKRRRSAVLDDYRIDPLIDPSTTH
jgi:hypothetical protein